VQGPRSSLDQRVTSPQENEFAADAAEALVSHILRESFEQGCGLPLDAREFLVSRDEDLERLSAQWSRLTVEGRERCLDLELQATTGRAQGSVASVADGFIILTQQCDLVREPRQEPCIEVARTTPHPAKGTATLRSLRSWRQLIVAEVGDQAVVADSRQRFLLDKRCLLAYPAIQLLPNSPAQRRRFAWWAGARYFRRPVPTALYDSVEKPLREALKDDEILALADKFLMFIVDALDPGRPRLIAVFDDEASREQMEAAIDALMERVSLPGIAEDDYDALPIGQTSVALFLGATSYLLDLEGFSGEASPIPPSLDAQTEST
jgi:hypothetical protein